MAHITPFGQSPKVRALCAKNPEMGPCQYERNVCRSHGGRVCNSGLIDFTAVLQTQVSLLSVQDSVANGEAELAIAHVRLYKALGGGWQPDTNVAASNAASTT